MTKRYAAYVPDDLWKQFIDGAIDHFEYRVADEEATAVFVDGRREDFSTKVTPEIIEEAHARRLEWLAAHPGYYGKVLFTGRIEVEEPKKHYQIKNFTSD